MLSSRPIHLKGKDIFNEKWSCCRQDQYICKERTYLMRNSLVVVKTNTFESKGHIDEKWSYCHQDQYIWKERTYWWKMVLLSSAAFVSRHIKWDHYNNTISLYIALHIYKTCIERPLALGLCDPWKVTEYRFDYDNLTNFDIKLLPSLHEINVILYKYKALS